MKRRKKLTPKQRDAKRLATLQRHNAKPQESAALIRRRKRAAELAARPQPERPVFLELD